VSVLPSEVPPNTLLIPEQETPCFVIGSIKVEPAQTRAASLDWSWLLAEIQSDVDVQPVLGRCLGAQGVSAVLARMQQVLLNRGWVTTRAVAPPQDLSVGVLNVSVVEGYVSAIRFAPEQGQRATLFNTMPVKTGDLLNLRDVEQGLENYKRVPTVGADFSIEPGQEPGQSELVIRHSQAFPFRVQASIDDSGSTTTGQYQGSLTLSYDNWWTLSDLFYITFQSELGGQDAGPRGNSGRTVHYSVPWGYHLLSLNSSHSRYHQTVAGAFQNYVYRGNSEQHEVRWSHLMQRDQFGKTTGAIRAFHRRSSNFIDDTEVLTQRRAVSGIDVSLGHRRSAGQAQWEATLTRREGIKQWGSLPAPEEAFGEGTSLMRLWLFDVNLSLPFVVGQQTWNYQGSLRQQWHRTPLTPQDRFSIGGRYTVRGFDGATVLSAESGVLIRNEVSTVLGQTPYSAYAGVDWGKVSGPSATFLLGRELTGGVLVLRANWKTGPVQTQLDLFVGRPLNKPQGFQTARSVYGFSLNTQF
jgi:hemolysin activation/secretion protein